MMTLIRTRRWLPFLIILTPAVFMMLWYINRTYINTVFLDGFFFIPTIGSFLDGNWAAFGDFFNPAGTHILAGYGIFNLLNAKFLALDTRLDAVMFIIAYITIAAVIYAECSKIWSAVRSYMLSILFIPLGLLCFSLVSPPGILMTVQFVWGSALALLIACLFQREFNASTANIPRSRWLLVIMFILILLYFLFFSGSYFPGLISGLAAMYIFRALLTKKWCERRIILAAAIIGICALLYSLYVLTPQSGQQGLATNGVVRYFTDPIDTIKFYIAGFGASLMDQFTLMDRYPFETVKSIYLVIGSIMTVIGVAAIWLFIRTKMYAKTYLPIYFMFYPVGIMTVVRTGRGELGWQWIINNWYSFHLKFFVIGVVWILLHALAERILHVHTGKICLAKFKSWSVAFILAALAFIFVCHIPANIAQWRRSPYVRAWLEEKRSALLFPEFFDPSIDVLYWPKEDLAKSRDVLKKYSLSSFSPKEWGNIVTDSHDGIIRSGDWYGDGWIGYKGYGVFMAREEGKISFEGYMPEFIPNNHIEVRLNDKVIFSGDFVGGSRPSFIGYSQKGRNIIAITCKRAISPASLGINSDARLLAFRLSVRMEKP